MTTSRTRIISAILRHSPPFCVLLAAAIFSAAVFPEAQAASRANRFLLNNNLLVSQLSGPLGSTETTRFLRLDPTFNGLGYRVERFDFQVNTIPTAMTVQPDGKVLIAAKVQGNRFGLIRLNANGTLDFSFAGTGKLVVDMNVNVTSLVVQPDGKIIAAGAGSVAPGQSGFVLIRFNSDGSGDAAFGGGGSFVALGFLTGQATLSKIGLRPDGRITAVGYANNSNGGADFAIASLNADGSLDQSFGGGQVTARINGTDRLSTFVLQPDGKIMAAGFTGTAQMALLRFNANGTLDPSFDGDGKLAVNLFPGLTAVENTGVAFQSDGKVVVAGGAVNVGGWIVGRYNSDGSVDNTFSDDGFTTTILAMTPGIGYPVKIFVLPDGRIMAGGMDSLDTRTQLLAFTRYNVDGSLDRSFDGDGRTAFDLAATPAEYAIDFDLDAQGRLVAAGFTHNGFVTDIRVGVMRAVFGPERQFSPPFDRNGDGQADLSVFRPSNNNWYTQSSEGFSLREFGQAGDRIVPTDFDADFVTDIAVFRPSTNQWFFIGSAAQTFGTVTWGESGDVAYAADMNGDGLTELIAYRPSNNTWYIRMLDSTVRTVQFGLAGDRPVIGDFDGDGTADLALYNGSTHVWRFRQWSGSESSVTWGADGDKAIPADYDGDRRTDIAVYRPSTGQWYIIGSSAGWLVRTWGEPSDTPVPADYDGDGRADIAIFRPSTGTWYIIFSATGNYYVRQFGQDGDVPIPSAFVQ